jgi:hypothetical protein
MRTRTTSVARVPATTRSFDVELMTQKNVLDFKPSW